MFSAALSLLAAIIDSLMGVSAGETGPVGTLVSLVLLLPGFAVLTRRLHDTNRSGWWLGIPLIVLGLLAVITAVVFVGVAKAANIDPTTLSDPANVPSEAATSLMLVGIMVIVLAGLAFIWGVVMIVFATLDGTAGPNDYGEDPKGRQPNGSSLPPPIPS